MYFNEKLFTQIILNTKYKEEECNSYAKKEQFKLLITNCLKQPYGSI